MIRIERPIVCPARVPFLEPLCNWWLAALPGVNHLCLNGFQIARPAPRFEEDRQYYCSVIIPARNEAGNIEALVQIPGPMVHLAWQMR